MTVCNCAEHSIPAPRRIDCFQDAATAVFGERMKEQVEERLRFYDEGIAPTKNVTAMQARLQCHASHDAVLMVVGN